MSLAIDDLRQVVADVAALPLDLTEADTEAKCVVPLLELLGWSTAPASIRRQVRTTVRGGAGNVLLPDLRLDLDGATVCVIETKRVSRRLFRDAVDVSCDLYGQLTAEGGDALDQVLRYAVIDGVPLAWITNGRQHLVVDVFLPGIPINERVILAVARPQDLIVEFDRLRRLSPEAAAPAWQKPEIGHRIGRTDRATESQYRTLIDICAATSMVHLSSLAESAVTGAGQQPVRRYSSVTHVPRSRQRAVFEDFWRHPAPMMIYDGDAGSGKTSLLVDQVLTAQRSSTVPVLFFDAFQLSSGLLTAVGEGLAEFKSAAMPWHRLMAAIETVERQAIASATFASGTESSIGGRLRALASGGENVIAVVSALLRPSDDSVDRSALAFVLDRLPHAISLPGWIEAVGKETAADDLPDDVREVIRRALAAMQACFRDPVAELTSHLAGGVLQTVDVLLALHRAADGKHRLSRELLADSRTEWLQIVLRRLRGEDETPFDRTSAEGAAAMIALLRVSDGPKFLLIVDAINECPQPALLRGELGDMAERLRCRLAKIVVSCRTPDLRFFRSSAIDLNLFRSPDRDAQTLQQFTQGEFDAAWKKYSGVYEIAGYPGSSLREICRTPLLLRLFCEAFAGRGAPEDDVRLIEIFDAYWKRKVEGGDDQLARSALLLDLAEMAHLQGQDEGGTKVIGVAQIRSLPAYRDDVFLRLVSEAVVLFLSPTPGGEAGVRFMYEAFHEYVLARRIRYRHFGAELTEREAHREWKRLVSRGKRDRLIRGALTYVALSVDSEGRHDISRWLMPLLKGSLRAEALAIVSKMKPGATSSGMVRHICSQKNTSIDEKRLLANAAARHLLPLRRRTALAQYAIDALESLQTIDAGIEFALSWLENRPIDGLAADRIAQLLPFDVLWRIATSREPDVIAWRERTLLHGFWGPHLAEAAEMADGLRTKFPAWVQTIQSWNTPHESAQAFLASTSTSIALLLGIDEPRFDETRWFRADGTFAVERWPQPQRARFQEMVWGETSVRDALTGDPLGISAALALMRVGRMSKAVRRLVDSIESRQAPLLVRAIAALALLHLQGLLLQPPSPATFIVRRIREMQSFSLSAGHFSGASIRGSNFARYVRRFWSLAHGLASDLTMDVAGIPLAIRPPLEG